MKFYSEITKKMYDSVEAVEAAEKAETEKREKAEMAKKKLSEERSVRAKEVEAAYKKVVDDYDKYSELLNKFIKDYGSYHMTFDKEEKPVKNLVDWLLGW